MFQEELFGEPDWGVDNSPLENVDITTTILYYSTDQLDEFKALAKKGIKQMFGQDFHQKGNLPIFLLQLLREKYGKDTPEETPVAQASGGIEI